MSVLLMCPCANFIGAAKNDNWCIKRPKKAITGPIRYRKYLDQRRFRRCQALHPCSKP